jgi:hypothetical protein
VVTYLQQATNNFRTNKKVFTQNFFCFTFNVFFFLWLEIKFLLVWKYESAVRPASGIMTLSVVSRGRGETLRFFTTGYILFVPLKAQKIIDPKVGSWVI